MLGRAITVVAFIVLAGVGPLKLQDLKITAEEIKSIQPVAELNGRSPELTRIAKRRAAFLFQQRAFPSGVIPVHWRLEALEHLRKNRLGVSTTAMLLQGLEPLSPLGPAPILDGETFGIRQNLTGRVTALALDPHNSSTIYLGAAQGGLWR
jgi:hypothetical protein